LLASLLSGIAFGLAAGLSPGPMMALVISQSVRFGRREGVKVAFAPLCSDLPVILLSLFVLSRLANVAGALAWVSIAGGCFVAWLGYETLRTGMALETDSGQPPRSLPKAILLNLLNPHVYLFWATVGGPVILRSGAAGATAFVAAFYVCLIGSKVTIALAAGGSRGLFSGRGRLILMRVLGAALAGLAIWLIVGGIRALC
jgi:threonine/homoserine/homoserine lactone efflux protein